MLVILDSHSLCSLQVKFGLSASKIFAGQSKRLIELYVLRMLFAFFENIYFLISNRLLVADKSKSNLLFPSMPVVQQVFAQCAECVYPDLSLLVR